MIIKQLSPDFFIRTGMKTGWENLKQSLIKKGYEITKKGGYDLAYANVVDPIAYYQLRKIKDKTRIIRASSTQTDIKGCFFYQDLLYKPIVRYLKMFYSQGDHIITISEYAKNCLIKMGVKKKIDVVSHGVNLKKFKYSDKKRKDFRKKFRINNDELLVLNVGFVTCRKGIEDFIKLAKEFPKIRFCWVGQRMIINSKYFKISRLIKKKTNNLFLTGYIDNVEDAYCGSDILLFPSKSENEGLPILEAAACKRPIITSDLESISEKIDHKKSGYLCKTFKDYFNSINELSSSKSKRESIGKNAYNMAKKYDNIKTNNKIIKIFEGYV
jgi:1,2-diacylglycerol-3-alpha-glucose alpha-1,2-glucosyltransferase